MRILIIHNTDFGALPGQTQPDGAGLLARAEVAQVAAAISTVLANGANVVQRAGIGEIADVVEAIDRFGPDVVFNLCESLSGEPQYESLIAQKLEEMKVVFTGNGSHALRLCLDKQACNEVLARAGVPIPPSIAASSLSNLPTNLSFPLIVKPNGEDGSTGICDRSVVTTFDELAIQLERVKRTLGGAVLLQRYIDGREVNVSLIGNKPMQVLPLAEIDFSDLPEGLHRVVTYAAKWAENSEEWLGTRVKDCVLSAQLERDLSDMVLKVANIIGLFGYARVDCRVDEGGAPWVIDVNPNCTLAPDAGFARAATRAGFTYAEAVNRIVGLALERAKDNVIEKANTDFG